MITPHPPQFDFITKIELYPGHYPYLWKCERCGRLSGVASSDTQDKWLYQWVVAHSLCHEKHPKPKVGHR